MTYPLMSRLVKITLSAIIGIVAIVFFATTAVAQNTGAIWTTTGSCGDPQNINKYAVGETVYLNGSGFDAETTYDWTIKPAGQGALIADGSLTTDEGGALCVSALSLTDNHIGGPYKAQVNGKNDNFSVIDGQEVSTGAITIAKITSPANGGPFDFSFDFIDGTFTDSFSLSDGESTDFLSMDVGTYEIIETTVQDWDLSDISCTGQSASAVTEITNGISIDLTADETVSCTFTNSQDQEPTTQCSDNIDNDGDGAVDLDDSGCDSSEDDDENTPPMITLSGDVEVDVIVGGLYNDDGATATDEEDGDITDDIVVGGETVDTNTLGTYTITYDVTDSDGAIADEVTRTVNVNPEVTECNDGVDNDGDGATDYPTDTGCDSENDNDENNTPVIMLTGDASVTITEGTSYNDDGATATDEEDGDITDDIVVGGDMVDINTVGTYVITYNVTDSDGASADEVTRTVNVEEDTNNGDDDDDDDDDDAQCSDGIDNDGDNLTDYPADTGCDSLDDDDENSAPVITLNGDEIVTITEGDSFEDPGATATDEEDGEVDVEISGDSVDTNTPGTYTIYYDATDSDGASAEQKSRTVVVEQQQITGGGGSSGSGGGSSSGSREPEGQVLGASIDVCSQIFNEYHRRGDSGKQVFLIQLFLNTHMNAGLDLDGVYGAATENAVHVFQQQYFDDIIMPWVPPLSPSTTGRWYKTTRYKAHEILGCTEDPVYLEDPQIMYPVEA